MAPVPGREYGAEADINDWNRAISGCPDAGEATASELTNCPEGTYDGETIVFATREKLQNDDIDNGVDLYEWHCASPCPNPVAEGQTHMISDGHGTAGAYQGTLAVGAMSASGADIVFPTISQLVGQDTDVLTDLYDARIDGGLPAPQVPSSCEGEACQGSGSTPPPSEQAATSAFAAGGNLGLPSGATLAFKTTTPKPLTRAQKLTNALKACKAKRVKKNRVACEREARRKYGAKPASKKGGATVKGKKVQGRGK